MLDPEKVADFVKKWYVRVLSLGVIGIWAYFCFGKTKLVYPLRMLLTGRNSYFPYLKQRTWIALFEQASCYGYLGTALFGGAWYWA